jgi:small subunit ribosomal protein S21
MSIRIKARSGESVEQMLRRFKKLCEKEGLTKDVKRKMNYEKPSERKRRDAKRHEARPVRPGSDRQGGALAKGALKDKKDAKGPRGPRSGGGGGGGF